MSAILPQILIPLALVVACFFMARTLFPRLIPILLSPFFGKQARFIAGRYFLSKTFKNAINIITSIALTGVMVVTAALILILSIFNGFEGLIEDMYGKFDPDIKIEAARGKYLQHSDSLQNKLQKLEGVAYVSPVIEGKAMLSLHDKTRVAVLRGLKPEQRFMNPLDDLIYEGELYLGEDQKKGLAVLGGTLAYYLNSPLQDSTTPIQAWLTTDANPLTQPDQVLKVDSLYPTGFFRVQIDYDTKYALVDFEFARKLFGLKNEITAYEIRLTSAGMIEPVKASLQALLGNDYRILDGKAQHETLYKVIKNEKLAAYLILTLMLLIAAVNIVGSLSMIIVEKYRDLAILKAMGAVKARIREIILLEGALLGLSGGLAGIVLAFLIGFIHTRFGLFRFVAGESFENIPYFPMELRGMDFLWVFLTVFLLSLLASLYPARKATQIKIATAIRR